MRELERDPRTDTPSLARLAIIGRGRIGTAITASLAGSQRYAVAGPFGRELDLGATDGPLPTADLVLICVPDGAIAEVAARIPAGPLVGHCSGATGLQALAGHEGFSLHPLTTVTSADGNTPGAPGPFAGAGAAVAGTSGPALGAARALAGALGLRAIEVAPEDRVAYHAAASIASNFLITLEAAAERLAATAGVERELLVPLVRRTVENWSALGPERALTGPVARGDEQTVAAQRAAVAARTPELLALFDACADTTRALVHEASIS